ncbi:hypothetical protein AFCDBAGC_0570 [Methylobacterium cerastii]|uniref:Uncharacterized protein n=1 Tax=Methylobacterium cerastii TaxID=932741 RepID=A0ABQ4QCB4_9HYPH|nr:hypothetical protein FV226_00825 [Methylobacterium sp. WL12]TXN07217.1 hypothetical protein FV219_08525 [Methylobacterium sp. WL122]GJD42731.1 hypothetical protein AFCDBAGC_0570 [Methylobacterium cerastii]
MSSDQVAKLAATIDVLTSAVQFLIAERVSMQPPALHGALLQVLQRSLSVPAQSYADERGGAAVQEADLARWTPIVATHLIDDVRRQLGHPPVAVAPTAPAKVRTISEAFSEMAERARRENARGALGIAKAG